MTAWQDQPPLSRRQVRQNERGESADGRVDVVPDSASETAPESAQESTFGGFAREGWDADARRADFPATTTATTSSPNDEASSRSGVTPVPGGRRAQRAQQPAAGSQSSEYHAGEQRPDGDASPSGSQYTSVPEPLNYSTQGRIQHPAPDASASRRRALSAVPPQDESADAGEQAIFRVRDFSPEGRRASFAPTTPPPVQRAADLDYRTQGAPLRHLDAARSTPAEAPVAEFPAAPVEERTISRRELRALEQSGRLAPPEYDAPPTLTSRRPSAPAPEARPTPAEAPRAEAPVAVQPASPEPPALVEPPRFVAPPTFVVPPPLVDLPAPADPLLRRRERTRDQPLDDRDRAAEALAEFDALAGSAVQPTFIEPGAAAPAASESAAPSSISPSFFAAPAETPAVSPVSRAAAAPAEPAVVSPREPSTFTPPFGHWSTQASIDDDEQFPENTISRNIGATSGAITTNALVIPSLPSEDALRPFGNTGEILITGTIDLPRSMGSTGAHPARYDHSDVDALLEATDREDASDTDSAPVRAIRAVSTHTSTRGIMDTKKPKGNSRLPLILAIAGGIVLVAAVVLIVVAMTTGIIK
jgi:hypothetical protein